MERAVERAGLAGSARSIGGFFALQVGEPAPAGAVALAEVYAGHTAPLAARIERVGERLGADEPRVAASIAHLGLAARLWSITLAAAVVDRQMPSHLDPARLYWDVFASAPNDLWLPTSTPLSPTPLSPTPATPRAATTARAPTTEPGADAQLLAALISLTYERHLVPLAVATRQTVRVSEGLLWGNAASALTGALGQLSRWCQEQDRPEDAALTRALVGELLTYGRLRGTGTLSGTTFRRSTCCLYYRAGGQLCGDCVFQRPEGPRPPHRSAP